MFKHALTKSRIKKNVNGDINMSSFLNVPMIIEADYIPVRGRKVHHNFFLDSELFEIPSFKGHIYGTSDYDKLTMGWH